jgi:hypothetical protein
MKMPYLLIAGDWYYPHPGTGNWLQCFETEEEALNLISDGGHGIYTIKGFSDHGDYDWYRIVDLRNWTQP